MDEARLCWYTGSDQETIERGRRLGHMLETGDLVALIGELGSGKTWLAKGICLGLGVGPEVVVCSPSFALLNQYDGICPVFHLDVYRLNTLNDFLDAGLEELFHEHGVVLMEWGDRWPEILPSKRFWVELRVMGETEREITVSACEPESIRRLQSLATAKE